MVWGVIRGFAGGYWCSAAGRACRCEATGEAGYRQPGYQPVRVNRDRLQLLQSFLQVGFTNRKRSPYLCRWGLRDVTPST